MAEISTAWGDISRKKFEYFRTGTQYYVAARFCAFAGFVPVCGNLYHHAIEMYLKGHLSSLLEDTELKNNLRHKLPIIWDRFKREVAEPELQRFDHAIGELHKFESIRYPAAGGMEGYIRFGMENLNAGKGPIMPGHPLPRYELSVDEIDELVQVIHDAASMNPKGLEAQLFPGAEKEYLFRKNKAYPSAASSSMR